MADKIVKDIDPVSHRPLIECIDADRNGRIAEQIRDPGTFELLHEMTSEDGGIVIDPTAQTISLHIDAATMQGFDWTHAVYDLEMISPASIHETIFSGNFNLTEDIELPEE